MWVTLAQGAPAAPLTTLPHKHLQYKDFWFHQSRSLARPTNQRGDFQLQTSLNPQKFLPLLPSLEKRREFITAINYIWPEFVAV